MWLFSPFNAGIKPSMYLFHVASNNIQDPSLYTSEHVKTVRQCPRRCKKVYSHHTVCFRAFSASNITAPPGRSKKHRIWFSHNGLWGLLRRDCIQLLNPEGITYQSSTLNRPSKDEPQISPNPLPLKMPSLYSSSTKLFIIWALQWLLYLY